MNLIAVVAKVRPFFFLSPEGERMNRIYMCMSICRNEKNTKEKIVVFIVVVVFVVVLVAVHMYEANDDDHI
jgi:hypothetical protein